MINSQNYNKNSTNQTKTRRFDVKTRPMPSTGLFQNIFSVKIFGKLKKIFCGIAKKIITLNYKHNRKTSFQNKISNNNPL